VRAANSTGTIALARTRSPIHWYTLRGSCNREVTHVKKDVRVNLARCTLAEMNSFRLFLSASPFLCFFFSLRPLWILSRTIRLRPPLFSVLSVSLLYFHPSSVDHDYAPRPFLAGEFLFIYGGLNEPWKSRLARCLLKPLERRYRRRLLRCATKFRKRDRYNKCHCHRGRRRCRRAGGSPPRSNADVFLEWNMIICILRRFKR